MIPILFFHAHQTHFYVILWKFYIEKHITCVVYYILIQCITKRSAHSIFWWWGETLNVVYSTKSNLCRFFLRRFCHNTLSKKKKMKRLDTYNTYKYINVRNSIGSLRISHESNKFFGSHKPQLYYDRLIHWTFLSLF